MAIRIKNQVEIEKIQKAADIIAKCFEIAEAEIKGGMSTKDVEDLMAACIKENGGTSASKGYGGFPGELCISVNEELIHGIASKNKILKDGDIVSLDIMVWYEKCVADAARTFAVGSVKPEVEKLIEVTKQSFFEGVKYAKKGYHINDIGTAIQKYVEGEGYGVIRDFIGHGVGIQVHEDPEVPNYDTKYKGARLQPGMIIAIEPMVSMGDYNVRILKDRWTVVMKDKSLCSHYENTVLITEDEPIIMTLKEKE